MRFASRTPQPRHLAGAQRPAAPAFEGPADFDVDAAFEEDFDFDALFAADDDPEGEPVPKVRVARHRVALAVSVTLAALPLLVLDNFPATADTPSDAKVEAVDRTDASEARTRATVAAEDGGGIDPGFEHGTIELDQTTTLITVAPAVPFSAEPTTTAAPTSTAAPVTTKAPQALVAPPTTKAPTTTTTAPKPVAAPTTTVAPPTLAPSTSPDPGADSTWDQLAECESGGNWAANTGNGYYGGLQFSQTTWNVVGGSGAPHEASRATQIQMGKRLYERSGWGAWPGCAHKLGWS